MRAQLIGASLLLGALLAGCRSSPPPDQRDLRAYEESNRLVEILSARNLLAASKGWPVAPRLLKSLAGTKGATAPVPQNLPPLGGDLPHFWVSTTLGSSIFWIVKTEGIAGAATLYGPLKLDDEGRPVPADDEG